MLRVSILAALVPATLLAAAGCSRPEDSDDLEIVRSAVTGAGGGADVGGTIDSPLRGYTAGAGSGIHRVVYRNDLNGTIRRRSGTPLGAEISLGGNLALNSAPWGYKRGDGEEAVVYVSPNRHVHETTPSSGFDYSGSTSFAPLAAPAPGNGPVPDVIGYVRADGRSAVVYRSEFNRVIEILSSSGGGAPWTVNDLTSLSLSPVTVEKGSVFPFVTSDGFNVLAYVAGDGHLHMLSMNPNWPWHDDDLSAITGDTTAPASDPWGYVRSDTYNCIVWVGSDGKLHETYHWPNSGWGSGALPAASPVANLYQRPSAYARGDGVNTVVYVGTDAHLHELALLSSGWTDGVLNTGNISISYQVFGHRPPGSRGSILFRGVNMGVLHGYELLLPNTTSWQLQEF